MAWHVCHETIYQAPYHGGRGGLSRTLTKRLRTGRPLRKRRRRPDRRRARYVIPSTLIDERPPEVEDRRRRLEDWEGDLIVGRGGRSAIGTLVERRTGLIRLIALPDGHSPQRLCTAIRPVLDAPPEAARRTLTWDQGSEMARADRIAPFFSDGVFFAYPISPWLRGSKEKANGLLRQYLPKRTDLNVHDPASSPRIEDRLNTRPQKNASAGAPGPKSSPLLWQAPEQQRCDDHQNPPWNPRVAGGPDSAAFYRPRHHTGTAVLPWEADIPTVGQVH